MAGPDPKKASELWEKLSARPRPTKTIPFPVPPGEESPGELSLRILTEGELSRARASADIAAKEMLRGESRPGDLGYHEIYMDEVAVQIVFEAARNPANVEHPAFWSPKEIRQKLTTDEVTQVLRGYNEFRIERGPFISDLSEAELEAWVKVLMEGASRVPLARLSGEALIDLTLYLASILRRGGSTAISSAASPPGDSSPGAADVGAAASETVDEGERARTE